MKAPYLISLRIFLSAKRCDWLLNAVYLASACDSDENKSFTVWYAWYWRETTAWWWNSWIWTENRPLLIMSSYLILPLSLTQELIGITFHVSDHLKKSWIFIKVMRVICRHLWHDHKHSRRLSPNYEVIFFLLIMMYVIHLILTYV